MWGYVLDSWDAWRALCLAPLDVEDVENVYLFVGMTVGMLVLGFGVFMLYWMLKKMAVVQTRVREDCNHIVDAVVKMQADQSMTCQAMTREAMDQMRGDIALKLLQLEKKWDQMEAAGRNPAEADSD